MFMVCTFFFFLLKIEIFSLIKSHYFSRQTLRSQEHHIKYLENFLDILHLPLEFFLSLLCALGGRAQMNSMIKVDMACGFQLIQLLGGASSDQKVTGESAQGVYSPGSLPTMLIFSLSGTKVSSNTLLWTP